MSNYCSSCFEACICPPHQQSNLLNHSPLWSAVARNLLFEYGDHLLFAQESAVIFVVLQKILRQQVNELLKGSQ